MWFGLRAPKQKLLRAYPGSLSAVQIRRRSTPLRHWSRDPDAIIRYLVVQGFFRISNVAGDLFWRLIDERIASDNASIVRLAICQSLARIIGRQHERVADAVRELWTVLPQDRSKRSEFHDFLLDIVVWLRLERGDIWARDALDGLALAPISNPSLLHAAVFSLWHKAIPSQLAEHRVVVEDVLGFVSEARPSHVPSITRAGSCS